MLPSVSTPITCTLRPRFADVPRMASTTRAYSPSAGPLANVSSSFARARRRSIARSACSSSSVDDLVGLRVDARRPDVDHRGEPVEVALRAGRGRGVARLGGRRRDVAPRRRDRGPALARALVGAAAVDAQQVAGLVLLRLHAEHALLAAAEHLGEGRRAQAFPVLEVVALAQPQGGVVVDEHALGAVLRGGQRARAQALERGELEQAGLEALVDLLLHLRLERGLVGSARAGGRARPAREEARTSSAESEQRQRERALDHHARSGCR